MSFSSQVKEDVLVKSARRCCLCQRFAGVKIEVHHIVPKYSGGTDEIGNAIPLCFDCHAEVGHYNVRHPKGTKYSKSELKKHRDNLYKLVEEGKVSTSKQSSPIHCRYLLTDNFSIVLRIVEKNLHSMKILGKQPLLYENEVLTSLKDIVSQTKDCPKCIEGDQYPSIESYLREFPDAIKRSHVDLDFQWFDVTRKPTERDIPILSRNYLTRALLKSGVPIGEVARVVLSKDECSGAEFFSEEFYLPTLFVVFLSIQNIQDIPMTLNKMEAFFVEKEGHWISRWGKPSSDSNPNISKGEYTFPPCSILSSELVLVPIAIGLKPLENGSIEYSNNLVHFFRDKEKARTEEIRHVQLNSSSIEKYFSIGEMISPNGISITIDGISYYEEVHQFDIKNLYTLNEEWLIGSCPFLCFKSGNTVQFEKMLFDGNPGKVVEEIFEIPEGITEMIIAELEKEQTVIELLCNNGEVVIENSMLEENQYLELSVNSGDKIFCKGFYLVASKPETDARTSWENNKILCRYLSSYLQELNLNK